MTAPIQPQSAVIPAKAGIQSVRARLFGLPWTPDHVRSDEDRGRWIPDERNTTGGTQ